MGDVFARIAVFSRSQLLGRVYGASAHNREGRAHHGEILARVAALVEAGKLRPLLNQRHFSIDKIGAAHALVEAGARGKVVVEL